MVAQLSPTVGPNIEFEAIYVRADRDSSKKLPTLLYPHGGALWQLLRRVRSFCLPHLPCMEAQT